MSDQQVSHNGKLNALNKKIIEVKKKIQLSEGQRKANFEECDSKKRECAEKIARLKKEVKELQVESAKSADNEQTVLSRESSACIKRRNLQESISMLDEEIIRLRKKFDLLKYQNNKQQKRLSLLLQEYEKLINGKPTKVGIGKSSSLRYKKKTIRLENQLHRVSVMQMEADTVRKKYMSVRSSLKADASFYASCLDGLEDGIHDQENEIKRLQKVKTEAIELRESTKESLSKQEIQAMHTTRERESVIQEYRKRVEERKLELERLERAMFSGPRLPSRDETQMESSRKTPSELLVRGEPAQAELDRLEEVFVKLRNATGVSKTEEVLDRFLAQRDTKEKLKKMQLTTEQEKMEFENKRQQLTAEIEMNKFSETKDSDQNAEKLEKVKKQIEEQRIRQEAAITKFSEFQDLIKNIELKIITFCDKFYEENGMLSCNADSDPSDPIEALNGLNENIHKFMEKLGGPEKYDEFIDQILNDKIEAMSLETTSETAKQNVTDDQPLFPLFPMVTTPAPQCQMSEDEEDIPSRTFLKRQAQLLVDTKSRRKGFSFKR